MKAISFLPVAVALAVSGLFASCSDDMENFDNKVYVNDCTTVPAVLTGLEDTETQYVSCTIAKPSDVDVTIRFEANPALVDAYNAIYGAKAEMLPEANYSIADGGKVVVTKGGVTSGALAVTFTGLASLDRSKVFVLPLAIAESPVGILASEGTKYFLVRAGALVNVAPDLSANYLSWQSKNVDGTILDGMTEITVEALLYPTNLTGDGHEAGISTVMGVEGLFLIRIGDSGVDPDQIQIATSEGNLTDPSWKLPQNKWTALAVTYDCATGTAKVYFDGVQKGSEQRGNFLKPINWFNTGHDQEFYIGRSWSNSRPFDGLMAEARVWNKVLTPEVFKEENHFYKVNPDSEGLVAYWKMNEGAGMLIEDYANGLNLVAADALVWTPVQLPAAE